MRYTVIQKADGRHYVIHLQKYIFHEGIPHYRIRGFIGGYEEVNRAWQIIERLMLMESERKP